MKSLHCAPAFMAESFWSKAATPRHAFHCVFALPVVKQLANVCAAPCSQSCDVSNVDAVMRYPNPLMAFARTLSPRSDALEISALARDTTVRSLKPSLLEMLTAHLSLIHI